MQVLSSFAELLNRMRSSSQKRVLFEAELIRLSLGGGAALDPMQAAGQMPPQVHVSPRISIPAAPAQAAPQGTPESAELARRAAMEAVEAMRKKTPAAPAARPEQTAPGPQGPAEGTAAPAPQDTAQSAAPAAGNAPEAREAETGDILSLVKRDWQKLAGSLSPSNRAVFQGTVLKMEQNKLAVVFRDKMSYRIAAMNREENGLIRLRELCREQYGKDIAFTGRIAKPGEFVQNNRLTDEDLKRINFPVDILPD